MQAVVLAAGKGTRMGGNRPKVLFELRGKPLLAWPLAGLARAGAHPVVVVVGHQADAVRASARRHWQGAPEALRFATQAPQLGTGHAVSCALPHLDPGAGPVWILAGDVPGVRPETLRALARARAASPSGLAVAAFRADDPTGYGRVLLSRDGTVRAIREDRDASPEERRTNLCNAGIYCVDLWLLKRTLPLLGRDNAQGEVYLPDVVARAAAEGPVGLVEIPQAEAAGVNTPGQLAALERLWADGGGPEGVTGA